MERMRNFRKNGLLALLGVVVIAGLLFAAFTLSQSDKRQESIVLPSTTPVEPQPQPETPQEEETSFAQVTKDNVRAVLERTIQRPDAYHQSYTVTVGADEAQSARTVELWVSGALLHAEVSDEALEQVYDTHVADDEYYYADAPGDFETAMTGDTLVTWPSRSNWSTSSSVRYCGSVPLPEAS